MHVKTMRWTQAAVLCALATLASRPAPAAEPAGGASAPFDLPASFAGELPCADCEAVRYRLDLFPDGSYFRRLTYAGRSEQGFDQIGRWAVSADGRTLRLTSGNRASGEFEIRDASTLRPIARTDAPARLEADHRLERQPTFMPIEPRLQMRGLYSYKADAGWFTECLTGMRMPVAQEGDNAALESGYLNARDKPGGELLAVIDGRIAMRQPMEGPGPRPTVVVDRFLSVGSGDCDSPVTVATLEDTHWALVALRGEPLVIPAGRGSPYLVLQSEQARVVGSGGCNRLSGGYAREGDRLSFSRIARTLMACSEGMDLERAFVEALEEVTHWRIEGDRLQLLDSKGALVAELKAV